MSEVLTLSSPEKTVAHLRGFVESLADGRITHCAGATTERGATHMIFVNGDRAEEGLLRKTSNLSLEERAKASIVAVSEYRDSIKGPVDLVWRQMPKVDDNGDLYLRLCFQPRLIEVSAGVWIEERLLNG